MFFWGWTLKKARWSILLGMGIAMGTAHADEGITEDDYFGTLPVVLTVSRLAQPISDTPGAVTVIDRDKIRRSGARDVTDLLRLVPGYLVSGWNGANPNAAYHTPLDDHGMRNLVMIDGRSVYSAFYLGDTHKGIQGVMLEDIERIEVLRGSNSAAYGANAMFGVINIVTRNAEDTHGVEVSVTGGTNGIEDNRARVGWGNDVGSFRLSTGRRTDSGYRNAYDDLVLSQAHFRGDLRPSVYDDILLEAGVTESAAGEGFPNSNGNPLRTVAWHDWYMHGQWRHQLSEAEEVKLTANVDEEHIRDVVPYPLFPAILLDASGRGRRINLELQHQLNLAESVRAVWGLGFKQEEAQSKAMYFREDPLSFNETRFFTNLEWRLSPQWLINAGVFVGHHSWTGTYSAPRVMVNYQLTPDQTLRFGVTKSVRAPSLFELAGDVRYFYNGVLVGRTVAARGDLRPETLQTQEVGYFGNFRDLRLTLDVRGYHEHVKGLIDTKSYNLPVPVPFTGTVAQDYVNNSGLIARGIEYQLRWSPSETTEFWLNQNFEGYEWDDASKTDRIAPTHATTLALFQKLPADFDLSIMYHFNGTMTWRGEHEQMGHNRRVDVRLAYPFRMSGMRAEAAVVVQSANGDEPVFLPAENFVYERRVFGTLRFEY